MELAANIDFFSLLAGATTVVKVVFLILVGMSIMSWTLIFYKLIVLSKAKREINSEFQAFNSAKDLATALRTLKRKSGSRLYLIGAKAVSEIRALEKSGLSSGGRVKVSADNIRRVLRQAVSQEMNTLAKALSFLATCANSAPFIGLFGTVWGIMHSFQGIAQMQSAALTAVAPGIAEALIATALGLAVAVPASIAYNTFLGMLNSIESELIDYAGSFLNRAQRELPWLSASQPAQEVDSL